MLSVKRDLMMEIPGNDTPASLKAGRKPMGTDTIKLTKYTAVANNSVAFLADEPAGFECAVRQSAGVIPPWFVSGMRKLLVEAGVDAQPRLLRVLGPAHACWLEA